MQIDKDKSVNVLCDYAIKLCFYQLENLEKYNTIEFKKIDRLVNFLEHLIDEIKAL